jgi:hypothetical protein
LLNKGGNWDGNPYTQLHEKDFLQVGRPTPFIKRSRPAPIWKDANLHVSRRLNPVSEAERQAALPPASSSPLRGSQRRGS